MTSITRTALCVLTNSTHSLATPMSASVKPCKLIASLLGFSTLVYKTNTHHFQAYFRMAGLQSCHFVSNDYIPYHHSAWCNVETRGITRCVVGSQNLRQGRILMKLPRFITNIRGVLALRSSTLLKEKNKRNVSFFLLISLTKERLLFMCKQPFYRLSISYFYRQR